MKSWIVVCLMWTIAAVPTSAAAATPPQGFLVVQDINEQRPKVFLGFTAWGDEQSLQHLSEAAKAAGMANERCDEDARRGLMVSMLPGPERGVRGRLYRDAIGGRFGKLEVEAAVLGVTEMDEGKGLDAGTAQSPNTITAPAD